MFKKEKKKVADRASSSWKSEQEREAILWKFNPENPDREYLVEINNFTAGKFSVFGPVCIKSARTGEVLYDNRIVQAEAKDDSDTLVNLQNLVIKAYHLFTEEEEAEREWTLYGKLEG